MKQMTREAVVEALVADDIDTTSHIDGQEYLYNILKSGIKGYDNYTKEELYQEYIARFNEGVKIK